MKGLRGLIIGAVMIVASIIMTGLGLSPVFGTVSGPIYFGIVLLLFAMGVIVWLNGWGALADHLHEENDRKRD